jgi:hypothetical protein
MSAAPVAMSASAAAAAAWEQLQLLHVAPSPQSACEEALLGTFASSPAPIFSEEETEEGVGNILGRMVSVSNSLTAREVGGAAGDPVAAAAKGGVRAEGEGHNSKTISAARSLLLMLS